MPFYFKQALRSFVDLLPQNLKVLKDESELNEGVTWVGLVKKKVTYDYGGGKFFPDTGYVLAVVNVDTVEHGIVQPQTGLIRHEVIFSALVLFPIRGEVIDTEVFKVKDDSVIFHYAGLMFGIVKLVDFPQDDDFEHKILQKISNSSEDDEGTPAFVSHHNPSKFMTNGTTIRVRIAHRRVGADGFWLVGTMKGKFLGVRETGETPASTSS